MTSTASTTTNNTVTFKASESNPIGKSSFQQRWKAKYLGPKLIAIEGLVKRQRTKELQSELYEFAESCLIVLNREYFKQEGLGKLKADVDYIPGSLRIKPVLIFPTELKADEATITCTSSKIVKRSLRI